MRSSLSYRYFTSEYTDPKLVACVVSFSVPVVGWYCIFIHASRPLHPGQSRRRFLTRSILGNSSGSFPEGGSGCTIMSDPRPFNSATDDGAGTSATLRRTNNIQSTKGTVALKDLAFIASLDITPAQSGSHAPAAAANTRAIRSD